MARSLILNLLFIGAYSIMTAQQSNISADNQLIAKQIKLFLFSQMYFGQLNEQELKSYFENELEIQLLDSRGFKDIEFYYIPHQIVIECKTQDGTIYKRPMPLEYSVPDKIIVARTVTSGMLYIVAGAEANTFEYIVNHIDSYIDPLNGCNYRKSKKKKYSCLYIEGIELKKYLN
ncbi:MAG TPA: hypothetical protein VI603_11125 [Saprospiraceae bacterium]|nr:hypothetical protein [Saprospiraceae bacterium]